MADGLRRKVYRACFGTLCLHFTSKFRTILLYLTALGILLYGCAPRLTLEELEARYGIQAPRIIKYGAVDRLKTGQTWRFFMAADDPDGDMDSVFFEIYQPGSGWYPSYVKKLKADTARFFSGYFYLNTPPFSAPCLWGLELTLRCKIRDKAGHESNVITLPVSFIGMEVVQPVPEGFAEEDVRSLGAIMIDLFCDDDGDDGAEPDKDP
ncbi:MAG: hypothetical protein HWN51_00605 [Desulfobacterales bacterium]|nr:hypothetical protein [Desulfobacterales bacterium]